jgi:hypothetical protein
MRSGSGMHPVDLLLSARRLQGLLWTHHHVRLSGPKGVANGGVSPKLTLPPHAYLALGSTLPLGCTCGVLGSRGLEWCWCSLALGTHRLCTRANTASPCPRPSSTWSLRSAPRSGARCFSDPPSSSSSWVVWGIRRFASLAMWDSSCCSWTRGTPRTCATTQRRTGPPCSWCFRTFGPSPACGIHAASSKPTSSPTTTWLGRSRCRRHMAFRVSGRWPSWRSYPCSSRPHTSPPSSSPASRAPGPLCCWTWAWATRRRAWPTGPATSPRTWGWLVVPFGRVLWWVACRGLVWMEYASR